MEDDSDKKVKTWRNKTSYNQIKAFKYQLSINKVVNGIKNFASIYLDQSCLTCIDRVVKYAIAISDMEKLPYKHIEIICVAAYAFKVELAALSNDATYAFRMELASLSLSNDTNKRWRTKKYLELINYDNVMEVVGIIEWLLFQKKVVYGLTPIPIRKKVEQHSKILNDCLILEKIGLFNDLTDIHKGRSKSFLYDEKRSILNQEDTHLGYIRNNTLQLKKNMHNIMKTEGGALIYKNKLDAIVKFIDETVEEYSIFT